MATTFSNDQLTGLSAAYTRQQQGKANATDLANLKYAQGQGWNPSMTVAPAAAPAPTQTAAPKVTQSQAPAPMQTTSPISAPKSDPNPPGPTNPQGMTVQQMSSAASSPSFFSNISNTADSLLKQNAASTAPPPIPAYSYSPPSSVQGLGNAFSNAAAAQTSQLPPGYEKINVPRSFNANMNAYVSDPAAWAQIQSQYEDLQPVGDPMNGGYYTGYKIPQVGLIDQAGQRIIGRSDNRANTAIPTVQSLTAQGYTLEKAPGISASPAMNPPSVVPTATSTIDLSTQTPFRSGLSQSQVQSIQTLVQNKPTAQWTATDKANWSYATNNAPLPQQKSPSAPVPSVSTASAMGKATPEQVNALYNQYFNRPATQAEVQNWVNESPDTLASFLAKEQVKYGYTPPANDFTSQTVTNFNDPGNYSIPSSFNAREQQLLALENQVRQYIPFSQGETDAMKQLNEIIAAQQNLGVSEQMGLSEIRKQPIAMPFISGQDAAVQRDAAIKQSALSAQALPLEQQIELLQKQRAANQSAAQSMLDFAEGSFNRYLQANPPALTLSPGQQYYTRDASGNLVNTASGGPPVLQPSEVASLAAQLRQNDITAGDVSHMSDMAYYQNLATQQIQGIQKNIYGTSSNGVSSPSFVSTTGTGSGQGGMRTDRSNNPTAMTTDVAAMGGLVLGKDYVVGDPFMSGGKTYYTAKLIGDPVQQTIRAIDKMGFQTASGSPRWSYINMPKAQWDQMNPTQKAQVVYQMYQKEGNQGGLNAAFQQYGVGSPGVSPNAQPGQVAQSAQSSQLPTLVQQHLKQTSTGRAYIDSTGVADAQKQILFAQGQQAGIPVLSPEEVGLMHQIQIAKGNVNEFSDDILKQTTAMMNGGIGHALHVGAYKLGDLFGIDARAVQKLNGLADTVIPLARALGASGRGFGISVQKLSDNVPSRDDSYDQAKTKLEQLRANLSSVEDEFLGGSQGVQPKTAVNPNIQAYLQSINLAQ
jgi:hypothetical protein